MTCVSLWARGKMSSYLKKIFTLQNSPAGYSAKHTGPAALAQGNGNGIRLPMWFILAQIILSPHTIEMGKQH